METYMLYTYVPDQDVSAMTFRGILAEAKVAARRLVIAARKHGGAPRWCDSGDWQDVPEGDIAGGWDTSTDGMDDAAVVIALLD